MLSLQNTSDRFDFNRGALMNIGYHIVMNDTTIKQNPASKTTGETSRWDCLVFHDLDMLPMDLKANYTCGDKVRELFQNGRTENVLAIQKL